MKDFELNTSTIAGIVVFTWIVMSVVLHYGFVMDDNAPPPVRFLEHQPMLLLMINLGLGAVGGILFDRKAWLISSITGLIAAGVITGGAFLYFPMRGSFIMIEIIIPLIPAALIGIFLPKLLRKLTS